MKENSEGNYDVVTCRCSRVTQSLPAGQPLGSFEQWCSWVRDPLLALGCKDLAERVGEAKERDGRRQVIADLFITWWTKHGNKPMPVADLADGVKSIVDPQCRGRQFQASYLAKLDNTRIAGFILSRQTPPGQWGCHLCPPKDRSRRNGIGVRGPIGRNRLNVISELCIRYGAPHYDSAPMPPMPPMPSVTADKKEWGLRYDRGRYPRYRSGGQCELAQGTADDLPRLGPSLILRRLVDDQRIQACKLNLQPSGFQTDISVVEPKAAND